MERTVEFAAGMHVANAVAMLVEHAREHGSAKGCFNDIDLKADADTTAEQLLEYWERETTARREAYRNSPEGKAAEALRQSERKHLQQRHDDLMKRLPALNMADDVAVLDWLCAMQEPSDRIGVVVKRETIITWFEKHGYHANENTGADYRLGDRKNMFRYLVGQALSGLQGPAIHGIIHKFADEWRGQFLAAP